MNRLEIFYNELSSEMTDIEIAAEIGNGGIKKPDWLSVSEDTDHIKLWDNETGSQSWGFITVAYD